MRFLLCLFLLVQSAPVITSEYEPRSNQTIHRANVVAADESGQTRRVRFTASHTGRTPDGNFVVNLSLGLRQPPIAREFAAIAAASCKGKTLFSDSRRHYQGSLDAETFTASTRLSEQEAESLAACDAPVTLTVGGIAVSLDEKQLVPIRAALEKVKGN